MRGLTVALALTLVLPSARAHAAPVSAGARALPPLPPTPERPVSRTYHGVTVVDPYEWLERGDDPEVVVLALLGLGALRREARRELGAGLAVHRLLEVEELVPAPAERAARDGRVQGLGRARQPRPKALHVRPLHRGQRRVAGRSG